LIVTARRYPDRPYVAASAAIIRDGKVFLVCRARPPANDLFTLPGGAVEIGETLEEAVVREVSEETALTVEPVGIAGYREVVSRDSNGRVEHHFVIIAFAARWLAGEFRASPEILEGRWVSPSEIASLATTDGLADIVAAAFDVVEDKV
jgi:ADP-ribose pyrophosphatase YjhB (NUDIX family)